MKSSLCTWVILCGFLAACSDGGTPNTAKQEREAEGELIPRNGAEKAKYYLIKVEQDVEYIRTLHSRVSAMSHGYSLTRIDCKSARYQDLGYGENNQSNIKMYDDVKWTDLVPGSSKSDLVSFACKKQR
ncbi:MAG: hypothetical protein Q8L02_08180 [Candidatus Nitrotoga sp.]|nr:hypothetical protein [Candidatus Nitrotoga sp.]